MVEEAGEDVGARGGEGGEGISRGIRFRGPEGIPQTPRVERMGGAGSCSTSKRRVWG